MKNWRGTLHRGTSSNAPSRCLRDLWIGVGAKACNRERRKR
jgi:hypothetical protein